MLRFCTASKAIAAHLRGDGETAGVCWIQALPFQVHVSPRSALFVSRPPKTTMLAPVQAAAYQSLPGGVAPVTGETSFHVTPSNRQIWLDMTLEPRLPL